MKALLPLGSVILCNGDEKKLMIHGRKVILTKKDSDTGKEVSERYDYCAVPWPEGFVGNENVFVFNHDEIERTFSPGYSDFEDLQYLADTAEF